MSNLPVERILHFLCPKYIHEHYDQLTLADDPALLSEAFIPWFVIKPLPGKEIKYNNNNIAFFPIK